MICVETKRDKDTRMEGVTQSLDKNFTWINLYGFADMLFAESAHEEESQETMEEAKKVLKSSVCLAEVQTMIFAGRMLFAMTFDKGAYICKTYLFSIMLSLFFMQHEDYFSCFFVLMIKQVFENLHKVLFNQFMPHVLLLEQNNFFPVPILVPVGRSHK